MKKLFTVFCFLFAFVCYSQTGLNDNNLKVYDDSTVIEKETHFKDKIGILTSTPLVSLHVNGTSVETAQIRTSRHTNSQFACPYVVLGRARGTEATPLAVDDGDLLGRLVFIGYDGSDWTNVSDAAIFQAQATEDWDGSNQGRRLRIYTVQDGATTETEALRIEQDQSSEFFGDVEVNGDLVVSGTIGGADYGEMGNVYGSTATELLPSADEWAAMYHANITGSAPHLNSGFSFVAGKAGNGTTTTAGTGDSINVNDGTHGLLEGDIVTVQSANHVTIAYVTYIDANNFQIKVTYVADEAITWQMGSYLLVANTGVYRGAWNASFSQSLNNTQTSIVSPFLNITQATKATTSRLLANNSDVGSIGGNGIMSFSANDRIWFAAQTTAGQTLSFIIRNVSIH